MFYFLAMDSLFHQIFASNCINLVLVSENYTLFGYEVSLTLRGALVRFYSK